MVQPIIVLTGPTAVGKTAAGLQLAHERGGAIISADSRMVYQGLDIGTGKPTWEYRQLPATPWIKPKFPTAGASRSGKLGPVYQIQGIDHYLLDIVAPETNFTLADWLERARQVIKELQKQGKPMLVVGGTGLYLKALIEGYQPPPTDPDLRAAIEKLETDKIIEELQAVDPETATREAANRRRLVRALEVARLTGRPFSLPQPSTPLSVDLRVMTVPRSELFARIDQRIDERLEQGMVAEVAELRNRGVSSDWLIKLGLEYREITRWSADGSRERGDLVNRLRRVIHAYARRQETFLRTQVVVS
ncbi:tRNA dimethylallyltransferase [Candidatus Berkelbacteria bacterium]|nr:tRNA dimethylallyltransferase [Candidatus Berkelbacteria bacterium]